MSGAEFFCAFMPWIVAVFVCATLAVFCAWFLIGLAVAIWNGKDIDAYIVGGLALLFAFAVCGGIYGGIKEDLKRMEAQKVAAESKEQ